MLAGYLNCCHMKGHRFMMSTKNRPFFDPPPCPQASTLKKPPSLIQTGRPNFYQRPLRIKVFSVIFKDIIEILHMSLAQRKKAIVLYICNYCIYLWKETYLQIKLDYNHLHQNVIDT